VSKLRSAPRLFQASGRRNSPPPELLKNHVISAWRFCEFHIGAMGRHVKANDLPAWPLGWSLKALGPEAGHVVQFEMTQKE